MRFLFYWIKIFSRLPLVLLVLAIRKTKIILESGLITDVNQQKLSKFGSIHLFVRWTFCLLQSQFQSHPTLNQILVVTVWIYYLWMMKTRLMKQVTIPENDMMKTTMYFEQPWCWDILLYKSLSNLKIIKTRYANRPKSTEINSLSQLISMCEI